MPEPTASGAGHPVRKRGLVSRVLDLFFRAVALLALSMLVSILMEWTGQVFFYPEQGYTGYQHAEEMARREIGYLGGVVAEDGLNASAVEAASESVRGIVDLLFLDSGLLDRLASARTPAADDGQIAALVKGLVAEYYNFLMAAIYVMITFIVRLSILVLSIPAFILFGLVGVTDGLMQRDLRRWCGGNESGYIYHWAKRFALPVLVLAWFVYLAIPNSVHPNLIITPFAVLFGLVLMVMASKFKKYL